MKRDFFFAANFESDYIRIGLRTTAVLLGGGGTVLLLIVKFQVVCHDYGTDCGPKTGG